MIHPETQQQPSRETLAANVQHVRRRITQAAARAGRSPDEVTLVAVTKQVGVIEAQALVDLGVTELGENRAQELQRKAAAVHGPVHWHMIGHLQRNKVRHVLPHVAMIHSADSLRLLETLDQEAQRAGIRPRVLIQVNTSGEPSKFGFPPEECQSLWGSIMRFGSLQLEGLMTMAALGPASPARACFALLWELRDRLREKSGLELPHLSMGMSSDFEVAVEEGATLVRIGRILYEGLDQTAGPEA